MPELRLFGLLGYSDIEICVRSLVIALIHKYITAVEVDEGIISALFKSLVKITLSLV